MPFSNNKFLLVNPAIMDDRDFEKLGKYIMNNYGIKMPSVKRSFLQNRLHKRLRFYGFQNFKEYIDFVFSPQGRAEELAIMIDAVGTHKTNFFRESHHFDYLLNDGLPDFSKSTCRKNISVWSAGCSTGEEPYSIGMTLNEFILMQRSIDFQILATDISNSVLQQGALGIYGEEILGQIPSKYHTRYLLKGKESMKQKIRIDPLIRNKINFSNFNLLESDYSRLGRFDIVFCRNVLIYFEKEVQYRILKQICQAINPGGFLFLGHSESINGFSLPLEQIKPTIFRKSDLIL
jgi:chemotaxis protein methyltransferase CheR